MKLADEYCKGKGVEIGGAYHNQFHLEKCLNIAPVEDEEFFSKAQVDLVGQSMKIDMYGYADKIPLPDKCCDYVISSHVIEHVPDVIRAFKEWRRVLKEDGIVFMIFPKRNALPSDRGRNLSTLEQFKDAHEQDLPNFEENDYHKWVFSLESMLNLIGYCNHVGVTKWLTIHVEETDSKVGNGHTVVCKNIS